ncbi:hypothetical protein BH24ACT20_BH24ACT20_00120 [soil metagenome]
MGVVNELLLPPPSEALVTLAQLVVAGADYNRLLKETARATARTLDADSCEVLRLSPDGGRLLTVASSDEGTAPSERSIQSSGVSTATGYALLCEAPVVSEDLKSDRRFGEAGAPRWEGPISAVAAPVSGREEPFGVLIAYAARAEAFDDRHAVIVSRTGSLLGAALERLDELESLRRQAGGVELPVREEPSESPPAYGKTALTGRQLQILTLMAEGHPAKQISSDLNLSIHTVHFHQRNLYRALDVGTSTAAIKRAAELGLLRFPGPTPGDS